MIDFSTNDERQHFEVIAQAEGIISVRDDVTIIEAGALLRAEAAAGDQAVSTTAVAIVRPTG